jgi:FolB domain-containing protein
MEDTIIVSRLELLARVGVPLAERAGPQRLTVSLRLVPERGLGGLSDDVANTVDYAAVCDAVCREAEAKPRRLIETLAEDISAMLLTAFPLRAVEVELRKYVLPGTEYAAVHMRRERQA